ncbi:sugar ABC transporter substrate-binding protein [Colwellia sp. MEBiC06753]
MTFRFVLSLIFIAFISPLAAKQQPISIAFGLENYNFQFLLDEFTQQTGITVQLKQFKNNDLKAELIQRANVDSLPDAVIVPSDFIGLTEIKFSEVDPEIISPKISARSLSTAKIGEHYFAIPIVSGNHLVMYYNKALIGEAATDWQRLITQKDALPDDSHLIAWSYYEMYWFIPFVGAFGEFPYKDSHLNFTTKGMEKALAWYHSLATQGVVDKNCDYNCSVDLFNQGKLAYTINGTWVLNQFNQSLGENLGVALLPSYQQKPMRPYFSSHVLAFPNNSLTGAKSKQLIALAKFFQQKSTQQQLWQHLKSLPTHKDVMSNIANTEDSNIKVILAQLNQAEPLPNDRNMAIVWEALLKGVNRYHAGVFDEQTATEYMNYIAEKSIIHAQ